MPTFRFYKDKKMTIWDRSYFEIEADSLEEATKEAIEYASSEDYAPDNIESMEDTMDEMTVEENHGDPTEELYIDDESGTQGDAIWNNLTQPS